VSPLRPVSIGGGRMDHEAAEAALTRSGETFNAISSSRLEASGVSRLKRDYTALTGTESRNREPFPAISST
jgi:hypothetical protein